MYYRNFLWGDFQSANKDDVVDRGRSYSAPIPAFSTPGPGAANIVTLGCFRFLNLYIQYETANKNAIPRTTTIAIIDPTERPDLALLVSIGLFVGLGVGLEEGEKLTTAGTVLATADANPLLTSELVNVPPVTACVICDVRVAALPFTTLIVYCITTPPLCSNFLRLFAALILST